MTEKIPLSADDRLKHLNELLRNFRPITRETDPDRMLEKSCQMLTKTGDFLFAWICLTDARGNVAKVFPVDVNDPFVLLKEKLIGGDIFYCVSEALKKPGVIAIDNRQQVCAACPFFMNYRDGHSLVCRLEYGGRVFGTLTVYRDHGLNGHPDENGFIFEVAGDIAYCLYSIEQAKILRKEREALRESEERHRAIFNNFPDAIFIADTESGRIVDANPAAASLLKMPLESIVGLHQTQLHPPEKLTESKEIFHQHIEDSADNQPSPLNDAVILRSDGVRVPVEIKAQLLPIKGRLHLQGVFRDITRRKDSESVLKSIFKASPAGIGHVGPDRTLLQLNEKIYEMTGRDAGELVGKNARILYPTTEDYETVGKNKYDQIREKGTGIVESRWIRKNGVIIDVLISSTLIDPADFSKGTIFSALDITGWKQAEKEIFKLSQAVEQSPASIMMTGLDGRIEYVNLKFTQITGYTLDEVRGRSPNILRSGDMQPEEYKELWKTITSGNVWEGEFRNKTKDGKFFWEKATIAPIFNEKREIINFLAVKKDITEQKALEEQLRQSQKMEAIGLLAGGVAHDFNNLLTIINGYSSIILADLDRANPIFDKVQQIIAAGDRAASLTRQLLAFSRKQVLQPEIIDINNLISRMKTLLRRLIGENIDLVMIYADRLKKVKADRGQIEQVIMNLVVNARDAIPAGGRMTFETKNVFLDESYAATHPDTKSGEYVMFSIADTGRGMDKETRDHIFEPFFTTKAPGKGTGLGLSTVYGIVRQSRGTILVFSEPEKGTRFEIYLPAFEDTEVMLRQPAGTDSFVGSETIMVVEDDDTVRELTALSLGRLGYRVLQAVNGLEALEVIERDPALIQLVITDVVMPQMGGIELAEKIIDRYPGIRLVFVSGYTDNDVIYRGIAGKKIDFIQKPFPIHQLARKIREILDRN